MNKFLYGAAVQGIQDFILQSNKLREIVGASELVAQICTARFAELLGIDVAGEQLASALEEDGHFILHAAGNVKYIFEEREKCETVVREFPKKVMVSAPGITISQAVVEFDDAEPDAFFKAVDLLESRLRIQRNRPARSMTMGVNGIRRSRQTGLPAVVSFKNEKEKVIEYLDDAANKKRRASDTLGLCKRAFGDDIHAASPVDFPFLSTHVAITCDLPCIGTARCKTVEVWRIALGAPGGAAPVKFIRLHCPG